MMVAMLLRKKDGSATLRNFSMHRLIAGRQSAGREKNCPIAARMAGS
jgi:hypothetical protein